MALAESPPIPGLETGWKTYVTCYREAPADTPQYLKSALYQVTTNHPSPFTAVFIVIGHRGGGSLPGSSLNPTVALRYE